MWENFRILFQPIYTFFGWIKPFVTGWLAWVIAFITGLLVPIKWYIQWVTFWIGFAKETFLLMASCVTGMWNAILSAFGPAQTVLAVGNAIFPLDTLLQALACLLGIWIVGLLYRLIKSYIPTIN